MRRREFIGLGVGGAAAVSLGAAFWDQLFGSAESRPFRAGVGYGPRRAPDENGIRLPKGFKSRLIAKGDATVPGTDYRWHTASDGAAVFPRRDGGYLMASNCEEWQGGASALRFDRDGHVRDAYRILSGTTRNCSGGGTPWGTWLSCEETARGQVWECDMSGRKPGVVRPAMGVFKHEAAAVDPHQRRIYMTEDLFDGGLYRFTPKRWGDLSEGLLEIARVQRGGKVAWVEVPDPSGLKADTRMQVPHTTRFKRGEGIHYDRHTIYITTTLDRGVHAYDTRTERIKLLYDGLSYKRPPLLFVDQLTASRAGEVFVCEDVPTEEIHMGLIERDGKVSRFLSLAGPLHKGSELTGVVFDPSGSRMYFSSQRAYPPSDLLPGPGAIYEVSGPFRGAVRRRPI
jgi:secreted PhoX family phosphatase